jgi:hypothetical protein
MNIAEIESVLHMNVGRTVRVKTVNGRFAVLAVQNVDQEGCSYRIIEDSDWHPGLECWSQFDEFAEVQPVGDLNLKP